MQRMKATVDSKEFATAVGNAMRWTKSTGVDISGMVILRAIENYLLIRTTVLDGDSILAVNAFNVDPGEAITMAAYLREFSWSTDGMLTIELKDGSLVMDYEGFAAPEISTIAAADFPVMLDIPPQVSITREILLTAATHTLPFEKTGLPVKSSVHIVPVGDDVAIFGTDAVVGYRSIVPFTPVSQPISIEAKMLSSALGGIEGMVTVGISEHRVEVASRDKPSRIQFSSVSCPDPSDIVAFFDQETTGDPVEISESDMGRLRFLASKAAGVDEAAEILVQGAGMITGKILGQNVTIPEFEIGEGSRMATVFRCDFLSRALSMITSAETYKVSTVLHEGKPRMWFIDTGSGRHFIMAAAPVRFSGVNK